MRLARLPLALLAPALLIAAPSRAQQPNPVPQHFERIYPSPGKAHQQVDHALQLAAQEHKRVLIDFGTDQCANCQVLHSFFARGINHAQLAEHFVVVHVDVGPDGKKDNDLASRFGADLGKGLPVIAVVDSNGQTLTDDNEFNRANFMSPTDLTGFLNKWRQ